MTTFVAYRVYSQATSKYRMLPSGIDFVTIHDCYQEAFNDMLDRENIRQVDGTWLDETNRVIGAYGDRSFSMGDYNYCIENIAEVSDTTMINLHKQML